MTMRTRKLIGTVLLMGFIAAYSLLVMALAVTMLPQLSAVMQPVFYAVAGLLWVLPAGLLVRWMARPD